MNSFCPFFNDQCHGNECVMWRNESCLIVSMLDLIIEGSSEKPQDELLTEEERMPISTHHSIYEETPECLKDATPEELALEMIEFGKKEFPDEEGRSGFYRTSHFFWESKGVSRFSLSPKDRLKMERANFLADKEITKQEAEQKRQKLEQEKEELPSLVSQCVDWARMKGLKRLTLTDIDAFLFDKELSVMKETKRVMQSLVNSQLKSKKIE